MPKPYVTGISPKEGYPGTKVIIRGENLGKDESDLISVKICGVDCTLRSRWEKESRITTYTGFCIGKGDIIVVTKSGGVGTSTVGFQGLVKKNIGTNEESSIWIEEDVRSFLTGMKRTAVSDLLHDNPLGISLDESSKLSSDFLEREFPNSSIDITKENFNPMRFLIENYQNSKFEDLKSGMNHMKEKIGAKTVSSSDSLIKNNISSFMDAIKIMKDIQYLCSLDKKREFSKNLEIMLKEILKTSHKIYDQDLASKDRADMIRNSLQVLDTYKSVIYFPQNAEKALRVDDYEQIVTSYKLAQFQLSKAESSTRKSLLFEKIKSAMEQKVMQVQQHILERLVQFPSNPDDQKYLIDYYTALEELSGIKPPNGVSPIWYCLEEEKKWFIQLMIECRDMHIADEKVSLALKQSDSSNSSTVSSGGFKLDHIFQEQQQIPETSSAESKMKLNNDKNTTLTPAEAAKIQSMTPIPQERNKFIEELCQMFFDIFSDYWKLGSMCLGNTNLTSALSTKSRGSKTNSTPVKTFDDFYALVHEILITFCDIVRAAFIPHTFKHGDTKDEPSSLSKNLFHPWPIKHEEKIISQILPHCLRVCRMCALQINSLEIPIQLFETVQNLIYDLRCECLKILLSTPTREILATLGFVEEDWIVDRDIDPENNSCLITNLPMKFEAKVTKALNLSKEFVLDDMKGEKALFRDTTFTNKIAMLLYGIIHAFLKRISRFMTQEDQLPKFVQISRTKLLLYLYNNLAICKRKILPNIWNVIATHKYKLTDQVIKESRKNLKELQDVILKRYMQEAVGPIVDSIEENLYAGRYDFNDSSAPSTIRNYVKIIIMTLLNVHSELFLLNKSLIQIVLSYAIKEIYSKLLELFKNIPQFCKNSSVQTYVDMFCLKETFKIYANDESREIMSNIIKIVSNKNDFEKQRTLMTKVINEFQHGMQPYIAVFQQQPPHSTITIVQSQESTSQTATN